MRPASLTCKHGRNYHCLLVAFDALAQDRDVTDIRIQIEHETPCQYKLHPLPAGRTSHVEYDQ